MIDLKQGKELLLMEKCIGVFMINGISNIQNTVVTENIKARRNVLKQLIFGIRNILILSMILRLYDSTVDTINKSNEYLEHKYEYYLTQIMYLEKLMTKFDELGINLDEFDDE